MFNPKLQQVELMDLVQERDRISNLPDDIIHQILWFLDMKYAVQTCTLSKKWKHLWSSMPNINLKSSTFPKFSQLVKHALSHRNQVDLTFTKQPAAVETTFIAEPAVKTIAGESAIKSIVSSPNVSKLSLTWLTDRFRYEFPPQFFSSNTLKHLSLALNCPYSYSYPYSFTYSPPIHNLDWDFPALETLKLKDICMLVNDKSLNLFSKCVKLKELTLDACSSCVVLNICAPQLSSLTFTGDYTFAKVNVVSCQLQNLTITVTCLSELDSLEIPPEVFNKVKVSLSFGINIGLFLVLNLIELCAKLHGAKYLILDGRIIEILSSWLYKLADEPCPFDNLKCLRMNLKQNQEVPAEVKNYFLGNSPNATLIMDSPPLNDKRSMVNNDAEADTMATTHLKQNDTQVSHKRPLESEATTAAKKVAKLEAKIEMQDEVIAKQKTMLEAKIEMQDKLIAEQKAKSEMQDEVIRKQKAKVEMRDGVIAEQEARLEKMLLQNEKLISEIIKCKIAELRVQVESGNPDYEAIRLIGRDIKSAMELVPDILRALMDSQFDFQYVELKSLLLNRIDADKWAHIDATITDSHSTFSYA